MTSLLILGTVAAALPAAAQDLPAIPSSTVSTERIQEGLRRPELEIPPLPPPTGPTFRVEIQEDRPETPLDVIRRELAEEARARAGIPTRTGVDILPAIMSVVDSIKDARHARAEAQARERVADDLAQFCAVHDCAAVSEPADEGVVVGQ